MARPPRLKKADRVWAAGASGESLIIKSAFELSDKNQSMRIMQSGPLMSNWDFLPG